MQFLKRSACSLLNKLHHTKQELQLQLRAQRPGGNLSRADDPVFLSRCHAAKNPRTSKQPPCEPGHLDQSHTNIIEAVLVPIVGGLAGSL
jgi:hypothetical protein